MSLDQLVRFYLTEPQKPVRHLSAKEWEDCPIARRQREENMKRYPWLFCKHRKDYGLKCLPCCTANPDKPFTECKGSKCDVPGAF